MLWAIIFWYQLFLFVLRVLPKNELIALPPLLQDKKVETFVTFVNSHLRQRQETERLKNIIARIDSYEPVVSLLLFYKVTEEIVL